MDVVKRRNYSKRSKNMQRDLSVDGVGLMLVSVYIVCFEEDIYINGFRDRVMGNDKYS